jgi:hypothetical protein
MNEGQSQTQGEATTPQPNTPDTDPIVETPVLNAVCESENRVMGDVRQGIAERVRYNIRRRRTKDAVAARVSENAVRPFMDAVEGELSDRIKRNIRNGLDR